MVITRVEGIEGKEACEIQVKIAEERIEESIGREKNAIVTTKLENRILFKLIVVEIEFELRKNKKERECANFGYGI